MLWNSWQQPSIGFLLFFLYRLPTGVEAFHNFIFLFWESIVSPFSSTFRHPHCHVNWAMRSATSTAAVLLRIYSLFFLSSHRIANTTISVFHYVILILSTFVFVNIQISTECISIEYRRWLNTSFEIFEDFDLGT